jgi:hypothetical protein
METGAVFGDQKKSKKKLLYVGKVKDLRDSSIN